MSYRDPAKRRSPALEKLAAQASPEPPTQTTLLGDAEQTTRLELAAGVHGDRVGCVTMVAAFAAVAAAWAVSWLAAEYALSAHEQAVVYAVAAGTVIAAWVGSHRAKKRRTAAVQALLASATRYPFPVTGLRDWLVSDRSELVVEVAAAIDTDTFVDAVRAVDPAIDVTPRGDTAFELVIPSRVVTGENPSRYGNVPLLDAVFDNVILPLHGDVGITRVTLGGTIHDR
ncbi:MAG TPA: hypothetical protein VK427_00625 [Kofleriaceae bacterium]|nr:hypothetical protein [Kofleriaceae bacterium]